MDSNISELVKLGHERAYELKAACGAVDVRSVSQLISDLASQLEVQYVRAEESHREFRSADITMQNLEAQLKQSKIDADCYKKGMEASNARLVQLAAENAGLKAAAEFATAEDMWIEQADGMLDYRYVDWYVDVLKTAMETPATDAFLAEVRAQAQSEVIEWLDAEITAIDTMYRGDPSYEHDAYWMKSEVLDVVELARKAFAARLRKGDAQ